MQIVRDAEMQDNIRAELSRFLAIRSAGHIEISFDLSIYHYARSKAHARIASYVQSTLFRGRSLKPKILVDVLREVDNGWGQELEDFLKADDERLWRELAFLIDRRNKFAHGQNHGLETRKALNLADVSLEISDWICDRFDPS